MTLETSLTLGTSNPPFATSVFTLELNGSGTVALNGATVSASGAGETLENNGNTISGAGTIGDGSGKLTLDNNAGAIDAQGGTLTIDTGSTVTNAGTLEANGGTLKILDAVTGAGSATVTGGGTLELGSTDAEAASFSGSSGTIALDRQDLHDFTGTISGFASGETIDLKALTFAVTEAYQWTENQGGTGGTLTVTSGNASESVTLAGSYVTNDFALTTDAGSGTDVVAGPGPVSVSVAGNLAVQEGQTLLAQTTLTGGAITYEWQSSADGGQSWTAIASAPNSSSYTLQESDETHDIRVVAVAPSETAISIATSAVLDAAPTITTPTIAGTAEEGDTLTASASSGQSDNPVTYQWEENSGPNGSFVAITNATGSTYQVQESDEGFQIEVVATATNDNGVTISATSLATSAVLDAAPTVTTPTIAGTAEEGDTLTAVGQFGSVRQSGHLSVGRELRSERRVRCHRQCDRLDLSGPGERRGLPDRSRRYRHQ